MTFHITLQFHSTISHHMLFKFTTPFCTTSHSVVHPGHRHSTSYNIPFHITPYNFACVSEVVCHWFRVCVCVCVFRPHSTSQCCSVYVISRVQIAFHITLLNSTPGTLNVFTSRIIPSHQNILHRTTFHVTPFHTTPFHITPPLHNIPHHIPRFHATSHRQLMLQHISPQTTIFYIWDHITLQSASAPPFHTTTSQSTFHITQPQSTSHTIPPPQQLHITPTFNITA